VFFECSCWIHASLLLDTGLQECLGNKRESGENPERARRCEREPPRKPLHFLGEGAVGDELSQKTCLSLMFIVGFGTSASLIDVGVFVLDTRLNVWDLKGI
jgi:hypothetical protein